MDYDKLYGDVPKKPKSSKPGAGMMSAAKGLAELPPLELPDTNDLKVLAAAAHQAMTKKIILMAYQSDNLPQVLATWDKITDRLFGKPEQSVAAKIEVTQPQKSMQEIASMALFAIRAAKENGMVIDQTPTLAIDGVVHPGSVV